MSGYMSGAEFGEYEGDGEYGEYEGEYGEQGGTGGLLSEAEEIGLASELLEIDNEAELEQFLGGLISKIGRAAGGLIKSPVGQALGGILRGIAKKALPMAGGALGSMIAPGVGTALGTQLGSAVSDMFELELESIPQDAAEFEVARRLVGLTAAAASHAAQAPAGASPRTVARDAVAEAAREYAPGLHRQMMQRSGGARPGGRDGSARRAAQRPGYPGTRPRGWPGPGRGYGGFADFTTFAEPAPGDWDADGDGSLAPDEGDGTRPATGRWVRRGRRIVLLGI